MSNLGDSWSSVDTGDSSKGFILKNGTNVVRIGSDVSQVNNHFEYSIDGRRKKVVCPGDDCPLCKIGKNPNKFFKFKVINRADGKAYAFECGVMIIDQIKGFARNPEYGNPTTYDIRIDKSGQGINTSYKTFASNRKSEITESESEELAKIDLDAFNKATTIEEIKAMGLKALPIELELGLQYNAPEPESMPEPKSLTEPPLQTESNNVEEPIGDDDWDRL